MSLNVILIVCVFCASFTFCSTSKTEVTSKAVSGPYVSTPKRVGKCENPTMTYMKITKNSPFLLDISITKSKILKGNLTVLGSTYNLKIIFREFYYEDGKWQPTFTANNVSCHGTLIGVVADLLGVKYNKKTCSVHKATYMFEVEYNRVDHLWASQRQYGRMLRTVEARKKTGAVLCIELESAVKPVKALQ